MELYQQHLNHQRCQSLNQHHQVAVARHHIYKIMTVHRTIGAIKILGIIQMMVLQIVVHRVVTIQRKIHRAIRQHKLQINKIYVIHHRQRQQIMDAIDERRGTLTSKMPIKILMAE